jgi:tryptophan synthase beta chain
MGAYDTYLSGNLEDYEYPSAMVMQALERLPKINL